MATEITSIDLAKLATRRGASPMRSDAVLDVTVVLLEAGYASTAVGPIEVFHSAGVLWNWLQRDVSQPRVRVRVASIDGAPVTSLCSLGLVPEFAIDDIQRSDIVILPASGWDVQDQIAKDTHLLPARCIPEARILQASALASRSSPNPDCSTAGRRRRIGRWPRTFDNAIPMSCGDRKTLLRRTVGCSAAAVSTRRSI